MNRFILKNLAILLLLPFFLIATTLLMFSTEVHGFERKIEIGDQVKITVSGHPEFSMSNIVNPDGSTDYPLLGGVPIDGLTDRELRDILIRSLVKYSADPEVWVIVTKPLEKIEFQVQGEVNRPGIYTFGPGANLQFALTMAGGLTPNADLQQVKIIRRLGGKVEEIIFNLYDFYQSKDLLLAPAIYDLDIIVVAKRSPENVVKVFGSVSSPGEFQIRPDMNVMDAIRSAGGFTSLSITKSVLFITIEDGKPVYKKLDLRLPGALERYETLPKVKPGDIIYINTKSSYRTFVFWTDILSRTATILSALIILDRFLERY